MERQSKKSLSTRKRYPIWIQEKQTVPNGEGGFAESWIDKNQVWAAVDPIQARQVFQYRSIDVEATHLIRVDGYTEILEQNRIKFGDRFFEILTIENIQEADFEKVITCKEVR